MDTGWTERRRSGLVPAMAWWLGLAALVAGCSSIPPDQGLPDTTARSLELLRSRSTAPVLLRMQPGRPTDAQLAIPVRSTGGGPVADALGFLADQADALAVPDPARSLFLARLVQAEGGAASVFFDQHFDGVPVHGAQIVVYLKDGIATGVAGAWLGQAPPATLPTIAEARAAEIARADAAQGTDPARTLGVGTPRLVHDEPGLLAPPPKPGDPRWAGALAWLVQVRGPGGAWRYVIDAQTGAVRSRAPAELHALDYEIASAGGGNLVLPCWVKRPPGTIFSADATPWFRETGPVPGATPDAEGRTADQALRATRAHFAQYGRDNWNGAGGFMYVALDVVDLDDPMPNATYDFLCNHLRFANSMATLDVLAHEYGHAVVRFTADLNIARLPDGTAPQSASLHEHFADVAGAMVDAADWTIGEDSVLGTIRDMQSPRGPDRMSALVASRAPHPNANIVNKAFYLAAQGDTHLGVTVAGIGRPRAGRLWHEVLTTRLTRNGDFQALATQAIALARQFAADGRHGFVAGDACSVARAFSAVQLDGDVDCDGLPDSADGSPDTDLDGLADAQDNCPRAANPSQADQDRDGAGDACDPDSDGDGVANGADNCPATANPGQQDFDRNGRGDACSDSDFDRVPDDRDNCPSAPNPGQGDLDRDGRGDDCDADADNDGTPNAGDNCPVTANPTQDDGDGDGRGDACDRCPAQANLGTDRDRDGIDDACDDDLDGDTVPNGIDNCPTEPNADQADLNGNGIGMVCDPTEQLLLQPGGVVRQDWSLPPKGFLYEVPLVCPLREPPAPFGDGSIELMLDIESSAPLDVAVVNRGGERLVALPPAAGPTRLKLPLLRDFCPLPGAFDGLLPRAGQQRYLLQLAAPERAAPTRLTVRGELQGRAPK